MAAQVATTMATRTTEAASIVAEVTITLVVGAKVEILVAQAAVVDEALVIKEEADITITWVALEALVVEVVAIKASAAEVVDTMEDTEEVARWAAE